MDQFIAVILLTFSARLWSFYFALNAGIEILLPFWKIYADWSTRLFEDRVAVKRGMDFCILHLVIFIVSCLFTRLWSDAMWEACVQLHHATPFPPSPLHTTFHIHHYSLLCYNLGELLSFLHTLSANYLYILLIKEIYWNFYSFIFKNGNAYNKNII